MITKEQLATSMMNECDICIHLFEKLSPDAYDYRPAPGQRSTLELLRYLAICASAGLECLTASDWSLFRVHVERVKEMPATEFPAMMARQRDEIDTYFADISEQTLETQMAALPGGVELPLGLAILNRPFKWLAAYKMQLFLYAKATGATTIGTPNLWRGADSLK